MKKKIAAALAATFALGVTSAFAANPFVDVPAKHWAYESVNKLAKAGIVDGYGDGTFRGDKMMSRYEMAQIVAKAMTKVDKADAEQKAMINKLSAEFSTELGNLGVRVGKLEANQSNVKFTGGFWTRYTATDYAAGASAASTQYRLRLDGTAKVDEATSFAFRFVNREPDKAGLSNATWQTFGEAAQEGKTPTIDRAAIVAKVGSTTATIGRQAFWVDAQGAFVDSGAFSFDGVKATTKIDQFDVTATYGRFLKGAIWAGNVAEVRSADYDTIVTAAQTAALNNSVNGAKDLDVASIMVGSKIGKFNYSLAYYDMKNPVTSISPFKWVVLNTNYKFDDKLNLNAEYLDNTSDVTLYAGKGTSYMALKATYGDFAINKKGANNVTVQYVDKKANSLPNALTAIGNTPGTTIAQSLLNFKQWDFQYNYGFSKNFNATLQYSKVTPEAAGKGTNAELNMFRVVTNVMF